MTHTGPKVRKCPACSSAYDRHLRRCGKLLSEQPHRDGIIERLLLEIRVLQHAHSGE